MTQAFRNNMLITLITEVIKTGKEAKLHIKGNSMSPFLCDSRDEVFLISPSEPFKRGDIVFFLREDRSYVMHRVISVSDDGQTLSVAGDAQKEVEEIPSSSVLAKACRVIRKGKELTENDKLWKFFAGPWISLIPFRTSIIGIVTFFKFGKQKKDIKNEKN